MSRKVIFGLIIILAIASSLAIAVQLIPDKQITNCKSGDGICPEGCKYDLDHDCPETGHTTYGEIKNCLSEADCVLVNPLCNNLDCVHTHNSCEYSNYCGLTAINKAYKNVWEKANVECIGEPVACPAVDYYSITEAVCENGECRAQQVR